MTKERHIEDGDEDVNPRRPTASQAAANRAKQCHSNLSRIVRGVESIRTYSSSFIEMFESSGWKHLQLYGREDYAADFVGYLVEPQPMGLMYKTVSANFPNEGVVGDLHPDSIKSIRIALADDTRAHAIFEAELYKFRKARGLLPKNGGDRKSEAAMEIRTDNISSDQKTAKSYGTSRAYMAERLAKDAPELSAKVASGTMTFVDATKAAGIRKPAPTPMQIAARQLPRLSAYERAQLRAALDALDCHANLTEAAQ